MSDWLTDRVMSFFIENYQFLEMSHDVLSLEVCYSTLVFVKEGKVKRNTCRITINENRNTNRIGTHVSWMNQIRKKAYRPSPNGFPFPKNKQSGFNNKGCPMASKSNDPVGHHGIINDVIVLLPPSENACWMI